jgi:hypothetical protein
MVEKKLAGSWTREGYDPKTMGVQSGLGRTSDLRNFLIPGLKSLGAGLRFGSEIAAGLESRAVGKFNVEQANRELKQLGVTRTLSANQLQRYANAFKGEQQTVVATSGLAISGSIVDMMADTAAQLKLQQSIQESNFAAQRGSMEQEKALGKRAARANEFGSYFRAATKLGESVYDFLK